MNIPPIENYEGLIVKKSSEFWRKFPNPKELEFQDLISEGRLAYYSAIEKYDPSKASFTTIFYLILHRRLVDLLRKAIRARRISQVELKEDYLVDIRRERSPVINEKFSKKLSGPARNYLNEMLNPSEDFLEQYRQLEPKSQSITALRRVLREHLKLSLYLERKIHQEIREKLVLG